MRNHIHQHDVLAKRLNSHQLEKRKDRIWYRQLKKEMNRHSWQEPVFSAWGISWFKRFWVWFRKIALITR